MEGKERIEIGLEWPILLDCCKMLRRAHAGSKRRVFNPILGSDMQPCIFGPKKGKYPGPEKKLNNVITL